jgi:uncharacterized membrane protein
MFELLFKYPAAMYSKGQLVLLGSWPKWVLALLILGVMAVLAWRMHLKLSRATHGLKTWQAAVIWALESAVISLVLLLLWQPAIVIAELKPQQNIIAVVVDDSRSMNISENGATREAQAVKALQGGVLSQLQDKFQTRIYSLDTHANRVADLNAFANASGPATHISDGLKQLTAETADLPIGAIVLLSDGGDNTGGVDLDTIAALRSRHIPVHTVGFGQDAVSPDVEMNDAVIAPRGLADSKLSATVSFHQSGYAGREATLTLKDNGKTLASREVTFGGDGKIQTENLLFSAGEAGIRTLHFSIAPLPGEKNTLNNTLTRLVNVQSDKRRILYVEGEPRWEYKFIRRAEDDERLVQIVSMLRTTENKIYRQGISDPKELEDGFPTRAEDLFPYQAIIIGSVEAGYFTPAQQDLIKEFVDRRGGGLLFLGGHSSLADGVWGGSNVVDLLPVVLPNSKNTFHRAPATVELTQVGRDSLICRLVDDPQANVERWKKLPYLMDYQEAGTPKPGAAVLAEMTGGGHKVPLLITENYGRGRTAVFATSGSWRWKMSQPLGDTTHDMFWQQLLRWLVADTPGRVNATIANQILMDDGHVHLSAEVRDKDYDPAADARVSAHIIGPSGEAATIEMTPAADTPGTFQADWTADAPGSYIAEITAQHGNEDAAQDVVAFSRLDGVAENFHTEQNRALLQNLATQTRGQYWKPEDLSKLAAQIPFSEAGITIRETKEIWDLPAIFLLILLLRSAEWLLRRRWGVV